MHSTHSCSNCLKGAFRVSFAMYHLLQVAVVRHLEAAFLVIQMGRDLCIVQTGLEPAFSMLSQAWR